MKFIPDIMTFSDNTPVTRENFEQRQKEMLDILFSECYGYMPEKPEKVSGTVIKTEPKCCAGHAELETIEISFEAEKGTAKFPVSFFKPTDSKKHPLIVMLAFESAEYEKYFPAEEIIDRGFAVAKVYYQDIAGDNGDFSSGIAGLYPRDEKNGWGKISMWAFGVSRIIDYFQEREETDSENIAVCGHSRLGKTALLAAAADKRIKFVYSNDSGCCGAAYERTKHDNAETVQRITTRFPYWFCNNFVEKYSENPDLRPFDQHFLIASIAPRYVFAGSATKDFWADQYSEQLSLIAAKPAWEIYGKQGFLGKEEPFSAGERSISGEVGYHMRDGIHFFSRNDWNAFMDFIDSKIK